MTVMQKVDSEPQSNLHFSYSTDVVSNQCKSINLAIHQIKKKCWRKLTGSVFFNLIAMWKCIEKTVRQGNLLAEHMGY